MSRWLAAIAFAGCSLNDDIPAPALASIAPDQASPGTLVLLTGNYFCQQPSTVTEQDPQACQHIGSVLFGSQPAAPSQYEDATITVAVPDATPGHLDVFVSVAGRSSNSVDFAVE